MKRVAWLTAVLIVVGATTVGARPGTGRTRSTPASTITQPVEHRTYCASWAGATDRSPGVDPRPLVWVLDGAGDLKGCSMALSQVNDSLGAPVELLVFPWSHGYRRLLQDQRDMTHARIQGARLAQAITEYKAREPGRRMVIVAHSAGCAVALTAGDMLPMDAVERVILLAPSVSTGYDIRPTLWSAKEGMDVFCSKKDWVALGFVMRVVRTTDNIRSGAAAGRWGFQPTGDQRLAGVEVARLRQHFWTQEVAWTGHTGGHHGMHAPAFVRSYLIPLMLGNP